MLQQITREGGVAVSYERYGQGENLVLVHGGFSDHLTNWQRVRDRLGETFTVSAVARRGRGQTTASTGHGVADEAADVVALLEAIGEPSIVLGHSYGGLVAVEAAARRPGLVRALALYEPAQPTSLDPSLVDKLSGLAARNDWDGVVDAFLREGVFMPDDDLAALRASDDWAPWLADAPATVNDLRALVAHDLDLTRFRSLDMPVLLLIGSESPREVFLTDALAAILPDVQIVTLEGQAHEGMTTAPGQFADAIEAFAADVSRRRRAA
ncbi:MAG: alpha/beta fold hydrolase [Dehalococcoidia bacterium]